MDRFTYRKISNDAPSTVSLRRVLISLRDLCVVRDMPPKFRVLARNICFYPRSVSLEPFKTLPVDKLVTDEQRMVAGLFPAYEELLRTYQALKTARKSFPEFQAFRNALRNVDARAFELAE